MGRFSVAFRCFAVTAVMLTKGVAPLLEAQQAATSAYMVAQVNTVPTPDFKGMTMEQVRTAETVPAKFEGGPTLLFRSIATQGPADGVVQSQTPAAGVPVYPGRGQLSLTFAAPRPSALGKKLSSIFARRLEATVPHLTGDSCEEATAALTAQHLQVACTGDMSGVVAQQDPIAGTAVAFNSVVSVMLQVPMVVVPTVTGLSVASAVDTLAAKRLHLGIVKGAAKSETPLPIDSQSPAAGTSVPVNTAVDVILQTPEAPPAPPPLIVVPYLQRLSRAEASNILTSVGLAVGRVSGPDAGVVNAQSPVTGTQVAGGTAIDLTLQVPIVQVEVPDMVGQSLAVAESRIGILQLKDEAHFPEAGGSRTTMLVESQDPAPGTMVPTGTSVVLEMGGSAPAPSPWKWGALGVAGVLVVGLSARTIRRWTVPHPVVTTFAHANSVMAKIDCRKQPAIRFTVTLRDRPTPVTSRTDHEVRILEKRG